MQRLKYLTTGSPAYGVNVPAGDYVETGLRLLRTSDISEDGLLAKAVGVYVHPSHAADAVLQVGDILLSRSGTVGRALRVTPALGPATYAGYLIRFRPTPSQADSRFLEWAIRSRVFQDQVGQLAIQSTIANVNGQRYASMLVPAPALATQRLIADFLDRETRRIDALIDAKKLLINLLAEKRAAMITHAVTKGLDPSVPMKESGIAWVGVIPGHWNVMPVSARFHVQLGKMLNESAALGSDQRPYVRNVNVQWWRIDLTDVATMSFFKESRTKFRLQPGDLLVCEGGEVGRAAIWMGELEECYYQKAVHRLRPRRSDDPAFLSYLLFAAAQMNVFKNEGNQATIVHLTAEQLRAHRFGFPSPDEQGSIVKYLDAKRRLFDAAGRALADQLTFLAEYRQALISAAVTGQLAEDTLKGQKPDEAMGFEVQN